MSIVASIYKLLGKSDKLKSLAYRELKSLAQKNDVTFVIDGFKEDTLYIVILSGTETNVHNFMKKAVNICKDCNVRLVVTYTERGVKDD